MSIETGCPALAQTTATVLQPTVPPRQAADIEWTDPRTGAGRRLSDFKGSWVLVTLWATWCPPCVTEIESLDAFAGQRTLPALQILPLSLDTRGDAVIASFYRRHELTHLPMAWDSDNAALHLLQAPAVPSTLLIDPEGREAARATGALNWNLQETRVSLSRIVSGR